MAISALYQGGSESPGNHPSTLGNHLPYRLRDILVPLLLIFFGLPCAIYSPMVVEHYALKQLVLTEGSEAYAIFKESSVKTYTKFYFYNYTNVDDILNGKTPKVNEVGPYFYSGMRRNVNATLYENGTLSYIPINQMFFNRNLSVGDETDKISTVNVPSFEEARSNWHLREHEWLSNNLDKDLTNLSFIKPSVNDLLWGHENIFVNLLDHQEPQQVDPGVMYGFMKGKNGTVLELKNEGLLNIFTGRDSLETYGHIEKWKGMTKLPYWKNEKCNELNGSTDGTVFPPKIDENETLYLFNPEFCRTLPLVLKKKINYGLIEGYRFGPPKNLFDTAENQCCSTANDTGINCSVRGIFNVSACKFGTPLAFSWPHFLYGDPKLLDSVEGLRPDPEKHSLFFDIEPNLGKPFRFNVRLQLNLLISIENIEKNGETRDLILPLFWFKKGMDQLSEEILFEESSILTIFPIILQVIFYEYVFFGSAWLLNVFGVMWCKEKFRSKRIMNTTLTSD